MAKPRKRTVNKPRHKKAKKPRAKKPKPPSLAEIRKRLTLSQAELAELIGVHPMTVSKWERGQLKPNAWQRSLYAALGRIDFLGWTARFEALSKLKQDPVYCLYRLLIRAYDPDNDPERSP